MTWLALRGISRVTAATTGLLLVYSVVYAMEGMTTRIPTSPLRDVGITTIWILPCDDALLFGSGRFRHSHEAKLGVLGGSNAGISFPLLL